jgi:hypothetical protein
MGVNYNTSIVTDGLVLCLDAASTKSYKRFDYKKLILEDNPIAYWGMGEQTSNSIVDYTGNGWDATLTGSKVSGVLTYKDDGCRQNISSSISSDFPVIQNVLTAEWWHKASNFPTTQFWSMGVGRMNFGVAGWSPDVRGTTESTATIGVRIDTSDAINRVVNIPRNIVNVWDGDWHHILLILNNGVVRWWVDGQLTVDSTYSHGNGFTNNNNPRISGNNPTIVTSILQDEIAVYNYELPISQIQKRYQFFLNQQNIDDLLSSESYLLSGVKLNDDNLGDMTFNGIDSHILIPDSQNVSFTNAKATWEAWVLPTGNTGLENGIMTKANYALNKREYQFQVRFSSGTYYIYFGQNNNNQAWRFIGSLSTSQIMPNVWSYAAVTSDGNGNAALYINGELKETKSDWYTSQVRFDAPMVIGGTINSNSLAQLFVGRISSCHIYNRNLSSQEIKQNFNALRGRYEV